MIFKYKRFYNEPKLKLIIKCSRDADSYVHDCLGTGPRLLSITGSIHLYKYYDY